MSSIGDNLYNLALTLLLYNMTQSVVGVAGMWLVRAVIRIPVQFLSGIIADKFNRQKISITVYWVSAVLSLLFVFTSSTYIVFAFVLIFLLQGTSDIDNTAQAAMLPEIVEKADLESANSIFSVMGTIIMLTAPGIGGLLYVHFGADLLFIIDSLTFVTAAILFTRISYHPVKTEPTGPKKFMLFAFAKEGYTQIKGNRIILVFISVMMGYAVLGRFYEIYKVYVADQILGVGAEGIVYFSYAMAIGSLLGPLWIRRMRTKGHNKYQSFLWISLLASVSYILWGNTSLLIVSYAASMAMGFLDCNMSILCNSIIQEKVDHSYIGRVMSFYKIAIVCSAILGIVLAPVLLKYWGIGLAMLAAGGVSIAFVMLLLRAKGKETPAMQEHTG